MWADSWFKWNSSQIQKHLRLINQLQSVLNGKTSVASVEQRIKYLRTELRGERLSYGELLELQAYAGAGHFDNDPELLEAAGVPEKQD